MLMYSATFPQHSGALQELQADCTQDFSALPCAGPHKAASVAHREVAEMGNAKEQMLLEPAELWHGGSAELTRSDMTLYDELYIRW